jgi:hypothetical protein
MLAGVTTGASFLLFCPVAMNCAIRQSARWTFGDRSRDRRCHKLVIRHGLSSIDTWHLNNRRCPAHDVYEARKIVWLEFPCVVPQPYPAWVKLQSLRRNVQEILVFLLCHSGDFEAELINSPPSCVFSTRQRLSALDCVFRVIAWVRMGVWVWVWICLHMLVRSNLSSNTYLSSVLSNIEKSYSTHPLIKINEQGKAHNQNMQRHLL